jgi:hypothetical protein
MRWIHVGARFALWSFAALAAGAVAQERGRSSETTIRTEQELKFSFELDAPPSAQCEAATETSYHQRNTAARVEMTIKTDDCAAAGGEFKVTVRVKDDNGETKPLEFDGVWQRSDAAAVALTIDYPIGENVELVSARVRGLTCRCEAAAANTAPAQD